MSLILSLSIVEHYAANISSEAQITIAHEYIAAFETYGGYLVPKLSADTQDLLKSKCTTFGCLRSITSAFHDALDSEYKAAQPIMAQQASDNASSELILLNINKDAPIE